MTLALYIRSTTRSLNQYMPKFIAAARIKTSIAPFWPPKYPPNVTNRAVSPAIMTNTFICCISITPLAIEEETEGIRRSRILVPKKEERVPQEPVLHIPL